MAETLAGVKKLFAELTGIPLAWRASTGSVDPWTLEVIKEEAAAANVKALGPRATEVEKVKAAGEVKAEIDRYLISTKSHPLQAALRLPVFGDLDLPKAEKLVNGALAILATGAVIYFGSMFYRIWKNK